MNIDATLGISWTFDSNASYNVNDITSIRDAVEAAIRNAIPSGFRQEWSAGVPLDINDDGSTDNTRLRSAIDNAFVEFNQQFPQSTLTVGDDDFYYIYINGNRLCVHTFGLIKAGQKWVISAAGSAAQAKMQVTIQWGVPT